MSDVGQLNGLFKEAYAKTPEQLVPKFGKLAKRFGMVEGKLQNGKTYQAPVNLQNEGGFTYAGVTESAYTLLDAIGMETIQASVPGYDQVLSSNLGYQTAARAKGPNSFMPALRAKFQNMLDAASNRLESTIIHGQKPIATTSTQSVATTDPLAIVIDATAWAAGLWTTASGQLITFVKASDNTAVDSLKSFQISRVDVDAKTIYVTGGPGSTGGSLANLETAIEAYGCNIHWYGSVEGSAGTFAYKEAAGLRKIISNTGELFGIDAASNTLWAGNVVPTTGSATMAKLLMAAARATSKGLDSDVLVIAPPQSWSDLNNELAAQRMFDSSYRPMKADNGAQEIEYHYQGGKMTIMSHPMMFDSEIIIVPEDKIIRIGARELGLGDPVSGEGNVFFTLPTAAGVGLRAYSNTAVYAETPAQCVLMTGITPTPLV